MMRTTYSETREFIPFEEFEVKIAPLFANETVKKSAEIFHLYQDYKTETNEILPSFLKQKHRFEDPAVDGFVAFLLSLETHETIQTLVPRFDQLCTKRERAGKMQKSEDYFDLLKAFLLFMLPKDWENLITRMFPLAKTKARPSYVIPSNFQRPFVQGRLDLKGYLTRELEYYRKVYCEGERYYSPYIAVCQSSGCGKTRLALEMSDSYELIYICTRKEGKYAEHQTPSRTAIIADFLQGKTDPSASPFFDCRRRGKISSIRGWVALLLAIFVASQYDLHAYEDDENLPHITEIPFKSFKASKLSSSLPTGKKLALLPSLRRVFFRLVIQLFEPYHKLLPDTTSETELTRAVNWIISKVLREILDFPPPIDLTFLLVIDEASELFIDEAGNTTQSYDYFRRALRIIPQTTFPFLCLLLDSNPKLATAPKPPLHWDSSHLNIRGGSLLIPPFIAFPIEVKNILPDHVTQYPTHKVTIQISNSISSTAVFDPAQLVLLSRPLFPSTLADEFIHKSTFEDCDKACKTTVNFAVGKLLSGELSHLVSHSAPKDLPMKLFAVAACRYSLTTTVSSINELLVQQHMAVVSTTSNQLVMANYPSEPILSEAAVQITMREDIFHRMLKVLGRYIADGTVLTNCGKDELGELVACILLSRGYDMASNQLRLQHPTNSSTKSEVLQSLRSHTTWIYTRPIPVMAFIAQLFASDHAAEIFQGLHENYDLTFLEAVCQFSHFVKMKFQPKINDLHEYLKAAAAIVCERGEEEMIDIIIPLAIPRQSGQTIDLCDHGTYLVSAIFVRVKNLESDCISKDLAATMLDHPLSRELSLTAVANNQLYMIMGVGEGINTNCSDDPFFLLSTNLQRNPLTKPVADQLDPSFPWLPSMKESSKEESGEDVEKEQYSSLDNINPSSQSESHRKRKGGFSNTDQQPATKHLKQSHPKQPTIATRLKGNVKRQVLVLQKTGFQSSQRESDLYPFLKEDELKSLRALCKKDCQSLLSFQHMNHIIGKMTEEDRMSVVHVLQPRMFWSGATDN